MALHVLDYVLTEFASLIAKSARVIQSDSVMQYYNECRKRIKLNI